MSGASSKRILIATGLFPPEIGGPATFSEILFRLLPERGFSVAVLPFSRVRFLPKIVRHLVYFFLALLKGLSADVIFAQDPVSVGFPALLAAKILRKRFVLKVVGDYAWEQAVSRFGEERNLDEFVVGAGDPVSVRFLARVERLVARSADTVIVPSYYLKKIVEGWGVPPATVVVLPNAFSAPPPLEAKEIARGRLGLSGLVVVSAGRLVPWKGFADLIDVVARLAREFPDVSLIIVGDGPDEAALRARAKKIGLSNERVRFMGAMPRSELLRTVRAADLFVLNAGYEGFSHQLLEAMAIGTPVITTAVGGTPEFVRNGENGLLIPRNDPNALFTAIHKALTEPVLRERMSAAGRAAAADFTEERLLRKLAAYLS